MTLIQDLIRMMVVEAWPRQKVDRASPSFRLIGLAEVQLREVTKEYAEFFRREFRDVLEELGGRMPTAPWKRRLDNVTFPRLDDLLEVRTTIIVDKDHTGVLRSGGKFSTSTPRWDVIASHGEQAPTIFVEFYCQSRFEFDETMFERAVNVVKTTFRHEIQHLYQHKTGVYTDARKQKRHQYISPESDDPMDVAGYYQQWNETDAYVTSMVERALEDIDEDSTITFDKFMKPIMWSTKKFMRNSDVPEDVARHMVDKIERTWRQWLRVKYGIE